MTEQINDKSIEEDADYSIFAKINLYFYLIKYNQEHCIEKCSLQKYL